MAAASTNPLSLTPDEIVQYRLAGLALNEGLPGDGFPHRGLAVSGSGFSALGESKTRARSKGKGKGTGKAIAAQDEDEDNNEDEDGTEEEGEKTTRNSKGHGLRLQHLGVLVTILQRCLLEGDIERAGRAWAMLVRMQVYSQPVDLRGSGYWGIGAELLLRSSDRAPDPPDRSDEDQDQDSTSRETPGRRKRWGTKSGLGKAKDYYERLILQHPYKRQFDTSVSALDFWPAMIGCEIYGIQFEHRSAISRLDREEYEDEGAAGSGTESEPSDYEFEDGDDEEDHTGFLAEQRRKGRRLKRRRERRWRERDEVRLVALGAAERVGVRLDEVMAIPPYSDSHNMLQLRGMLALYLGDLNVPDSPDQSGEGTEERLLRRQRIAERGRGLKRRGEEREKAKKCFERIRRGGGVVEGVRGLGDEEDDDEGDGVEET